MAVFDGVIPAIVGAANAAAGGYEIERSLRFNDDDSAYLNRTPSSAGSQTTFTWACWTKLSKIGGLLNFLNAGDNSTIGRSIFRYHQNQFQFIASAVGGTTSASVYSTAVFRDPSAWYHVVWSVDTTQATDTDRVKLYVNGVQQTFSTYTAPAQSGTFSINHNSLHKISGAVYTSLQYFDGYLADCHLIDGQALAASDFGEYDDNNVWQPKAYSGSYGTNGFHLKFDDTSSDAALGTDSSGNNNTWTVNNIRAYPNLPYADYWTGTFLAGEPGANAFDGSSVTAARPDSSQTITWTPATSIPFTKLRMRAAKSGAGTNISVNGTDVTESFNPQNTVDITSLVSSPLTSISLTSTASERPKLMFVEVDDVVLISGHNTDSFIDSPTNYTAGSGNNGGNYATLNRLITNSTTTLANGDLDVTSSGQTNAVSTIAPSSGKWYFEITLGSIVTNSFIGLYGTNPLNSSYLVYGINGYGFLNTGWGSPTNTVTGTGVAGDVIGLAFDADAKTLEYYKNGSSIGTISGWTYVNNWSIGFSANTTISTPWVFNFGQRPFAYTPPTNYLSLCTTNVSDPTIPEGSQEMDIELWTGTGSGGGSDQTITGYNFAPQFVWIKNRGANEHHALFDQIRGATKVLYSSLSNAEATQTNGLMSFTSDGFELGIDGKVNGNGQAIVGWAWDSATSTSSNTDGSITTQVRVNASAGFSIVTWTGDGTTATIGHGLSDQPSLILVKNRDDGIDWRVYHNGGDLTTTSGGAYSPFYFWRLNTDGAKDGSAVNGFTNTRANSTVFSYAANVNVNNQDHVAYCWAAVAGYSAFGNYTGNGSTDGPFVYTGFRPRFLMVRSASSPRRWGMFDAERFPFNGPQMPTIYANVSDAETTTAENAGDFLSNGFKVRYTNGNWNGSGENYIYAAFAEHPFKTARAR